MKALLLMAAFFELYLAVGLLPGEERMISSRLMIVWRALKRTRKGLRDANAKAWHHGDLNRNTESMFQSYLRVAAEYGK